MWMHQEFGCSRRVKIYWSLVYIFHIIIFLWVFFCELEIGKVFLKWCYIAIDAKLPVESTAFFSFYYR